MKSVVLLLVIVSLNFLSFSNIKAHGMGYGSSAPKNNKALAVRSSQQAAQMVKNRFGGKVLKVKKSSSKRGIGYRVKLLKADGRIISVMVDATTGRIN